MLSFPFVQPMDAAKRLMERKRTSAGGLLMLINAPDCLSVYDHATDAESGTKDALLCVIAACAVGDRCGGTEPSR